MFKTTRSLLSAALAASMLLWGGAASADRGHRYDDDRPRHEWRHDRDHHRWHDHRRHHRHEARWRDEPRVVVRERVIIRERPVYREVVPYPVYGDPGVFIGFNIPPIYIPIR